MPQTAATLAHIPQQPTFDIGRNRACGSRLEFAQTTKSAICNQKTKAHAQPPKIYHLACDVRVALMSIVIVSPTNDLLLHTNKHEQTTRTTENTNHKATLMHVVCLSYFDAGQTAKRHTDRISNKRETESKATMKPKGDKTSHEIAQPIL